MTDHDPRVSALLEQMIPADRETRDWDRILADAQASPTVVAASRRPDRRTLVVAVVATLAILVPLSALAVGLATGQGWWFLSDYGPKPAGGVVVIESGTWDGVAWNLTAFRATTGKVCYAVTINPPQPQRAGSAQACSPITTTVKIGFLRQTGTPDETPIQAEGRRRMIPWLKERGLPRPPVQVAVSGYIVGAVVGSATEVDVAGPGTPLQHIPTTAAPAALQTDVRFFVAQRPDSEDLSSLTARDARGRTVAAMTVDSPYRHTYRLSNRGTKLQLSQAAIHQLKLRHRTPDIYLLASRNGRNVYRLGTNGRCYGSGRASNLSWTPASNVLHILGIVDCGPGFPSPTHPIRDSSIWGQSAGEKLMTLYQFAGIASDQIIAIDLVNADGALVKRVPVIDNVFTARSVPPGIVGVNPINTGGVWVSRCGFGKGSYLTSRC